MKINKIILSLSFVLLASSTFAQQQNREDVVFKAMRDEAARTKTIKMGQMPPPFFFDYYLEDSRSLSITSQYGSVISINKDNGSSKLGSQIFVGTTKNSSKLDYSGKIGAMQATSDNNYLSLRTSLWSISDILYKNSLQEYQVKDGAIKQMTLSPEEKEMADFIKVPAVKSISQEKGLVFDEAKWSGVCNKLSEIFKKYPDLTGTSVAYSAVDKVFYIFNTNGLELKQNGCYVNIAANASIQDESGVIMRNSFSIFASEDGDLPTEAELEKRVEEFAKKMSSLKKVENIKEYYNGPVMFTGGSVTNIFANTLLGNSGVIATKGLTKTGWMFNPIERRLGKKVIDTRLTVKNFTALKEYKGKKIIGSYDIDADGVKPEAEMTLIENGILKQMLNGTSETTVNFKSTGSSRMAMAGREMVKLVYPAILQVSVANGMKESAMKKQLIKLAKEEGLKYAYIVHNASESCPEVYRVDVKSGDETRIGSTKISSIDMAMLRRLAAVSTEESVVSSLINGIMMTVITPKAIIINDVEIDMNKLNKSAQPLLTSPLKR